MISFLTPEMFAFIMFGSTLLLLLLGFPVALTLGGSALLFAFAGAQLGLFNTGVFALYPLRLFGVMRNEPLVAVPLFIFMGLVLEQTDLAGRLLTTMGRMFGSWPGGLGISVIIVGAMLAASTGIAGATVVTMGLISLPVMLRANYDPRLASGLICSSGTLGQIIPPSIVLVLLGDILQGANEQASELKGELVPEPVTAIDLFAGALFPGLLLVGLYLGWQVAMSIFRPESCPPIGLEADEESPALGEMIKVIIPPFVLIILVLGSILTGLATPTESAAVGAVGAMVLAIQARKFSFETLKTVGQGTVKITSMVFVILIGASMFSLVFRGFGGDAVVEKFLATLPGGPLGAMLFVMAMMFFLGFFLDFIEIIFVVVPIVGPSLIAMGFDPLWLGVMIGVNLQMSFLTPPFGFALFYLRGVAPEEVKTGSIYAGMVPFIAIQIAALGLIWVFPEIVTWLPGVIFG